MSQKRERSVNFTREETDLLIKLVEENKDVIENKKSDAITWNEKEGCWKQIENTFNSKSGVTYRSAKTLKIKYESIKRETRKKSATIRAETYRTGGGPSTAPVLTATEEKVKNMILLSVEGMESVFDSDNVFQTVDEKSPRPTFVHTPLDNHTINLDSGEVKENICRSESPDEYVMVITADENETEKTPVRSLKRRSLGEIQLTPDYKAEGSNDMGNADETPNKKWSQWKPSVLRSKKHPALCKPKPRRPFEKLAEVKISVADLQQQILTEELENKRKTWAFEEKERAQQQKRWDFEEEQRENKRKMWDLEKQAMLNKINK